MHQPIRLAFIAAGDCPGLTAGAKLKDYREKEISDLSMTFCISSVFSILLICSLVLTQDAHANSLRHKIASSQRNTTDLSLQSPLVQAGYEDSENVEPHFILNRSYNEVRKRRSKRKRQSASRSVKNFAHNQLASHYKKPRNNLRSSDNREVKIYETFEEIHEHVNEPDDQDAPRQASKRFESDEEPVVAEESVVEKKQEAPMKVKIKHHHHHHHHNHIKEIIKTVPKPYPVEKIVHVPIEKIVEKIVQVPKFINVTVEKVVHVPVEKVIEKVVHVPRPVQVPKPYVVEKIMEKIVHVPKPYPVLKTVPYPVEIKVPVQVEKKVPVPYAVEVERKIPVYIKSQEPYKYEPTNYKHYDEDDGQKFSHSYDETVHQPVYFSDNYSSSPRFGASKQSDSPRKPYYPSYANQQTNLDVSKQPTAMAQFAGENYSYNSRFSFPKQPEASSKPQYQSFPDTLDKQQTTVDSTKQTTAMEQSAAESSFIPVNFVDTKAPFNIIVANNENDTSLDSNQQTFGNKMQAIPFSFPIEFIQLQPMPFQNSIPMEAATTQSTTKAT